jgi:hypothetical protein
MMNLRETGGVVPAGLMGKTMPQEIGLLQQCAVPELGDGIAEPSVAGSRTRGCPPRSIQRPTQNPVPEALLRLYAFSFANDGPGNGLLHGEGRAFQ